MANRKDWVVKAIVKNVFLFSVFGDAIVSEVVMFGGEKATKVTWLFCNHNPSILASNKYFAGLIGKTNDPLHCTGSLVGPIGPTRYLLLALSGY